ncbi:MAG: hypothetical protein NC912_04730 [Candidatus Omnitrophica bacterium]|nr:hypothetical protein [Candidatus Omnitrophota bacterium]
MKILIKFFLVSLIIFLFGLIGFYVFFNLKGSSILTKRLEGILNKEVKIDKFSISWPLNLTTEQFEIKDLFKIDKIFLKIEGINIFRKVITISEIKIDGFKMGPLLFKNIEKKTQPLDLISNYPKIIPFCFIIKHLIIENGNLSFVDNHISEKGLSILIKDFKLKVENIIFPINSPYIISFELRGNIPCQEKVNEASIELIGWANLFKRDMLAFLDIKGIDGIYFYPYYSKWVDLEKSKITKAIFNFTSNLYSLNNDLTADCNLELVEIAFKPRTSGEQEEKAERIALAILDIFKYIDGERINLQFTVKTKMDKPEFNLEIIHDAFKQKISYGYKEKKQLSIDDILNLPGKVIEETLKQATGITKTVITETIKAGVKVKDALGNTIKEEKDNAKDN